MEQYSKQSEDNQSIEPSEDETPFSEKDVSSSERKQIKRGSKKAAKSTTEICYRNNEWLINLIQLNPQKMNQIINWIDSFISFLSDFEVKGCQNISSFNFARIKPNEQSYFIFIQEFAQFFHLTRIIDESGHIVSFKIYENSSKQPYLQVILKKIGRKVPVFIFNQTNDVSYLNRVLQRHNPCNIIAIIPEQQVLALDKTSKWTFDKKALQGTHYRYYFNQRKKIQNISSTIEKIAQLDSLNIQKVNQILDYSTIESRNFVLSKFLIRNIAISNKNLLDKDQLEVILRQGVTGVHLHLQNWESNESNHLPGPSQAKKISCNYCHRKKSDVVCIGCGNVYGREVNLCIGDCFHKFHEERRMFMRKQKSQICKGIAYFSEKCKQIGESMDRLIEEGSIQYQQFMEYLQARIVDSLNKLVEKKYAVYDEEAETNE